MILSMAVSAQDNVNYPTPLTEQHLGMFHRWKPIPSRNLIWQNIYMKKLGSWYSWDVNESNKSFTGCHLFQHDFVQSF